MHTIHCVPEKEHYFGNNMDKKEVHVINFYADYYLKNSILFFENFHFFKEIFLLRLKCFEAFSKVITKNKYKSEMRRTCDEIAK